MDNLKGTTARLRRTFAYPTDDSSAASSAHEALDEEEQEHLIRTLATSNATSNRTYEHILLAIPLLSCIAFLPSIFFLPKHDRPSPVLPSLLAITSLLSTAFLLRALPTAQTGMPWLDRWAATPSSKPSASGARADHNASDDDDDSSYPAPTPLPSRRRRRSLAATDTSFAPAILSEGPLLTYLPYLNAFLALLVLLSGWLGKGVVGPPPYYLPTLVYAAVVVAKVVMAGVDVEGELGGLRYGYKGA